MPHCLRVKERVTKLSLERFFFFGMAIYKRGKCGGVREINLKGEQMTERKSNCLRDFTSPNGLAQI